MSKSDIKHLTNEEFLMIARDLEIHHAVFAKIWNVGKPSFTDKIPTACVTFDREGNHLDFQFNPNFWDAATPYERLFIICHECLHIILNHGVRLKTLNEDIGNVAADVVINELLLSGFGFDRNKVIWIDKNGCWMDTIFKDFKFPVDKDRSMEYYYNILKKDFIEQIKAALASGKLKIVDDHGGMRGIDSTDLEDVLGEILDGMNDSEKESLNKTFKEVTPQEAQECSKQAGTMPGNLEITIKTGFIKKKKKWETVIKRWANRYIRDADKNHEQWARVNRRFVGIISTMSNMFLPSEMEIEEREEVKKRIKVWFFQDTSGSCIHLAERFFKAAKSLNPKRFDIEMYCFDTQCYKTTLASGKLYGFGGTRFDILEEEVWSHCKGNMRNYPKTIWVVTDGFGNNIYPKIPNRWHWFLSEKNAGYIPTTCNIFNLYDFE